MSKNWVIFGVILVAVGVGTEYLLLWAMSGLPRHEKLYLLGCILIFLGLTIPLWKYRLAEFLYESEKRYRAKEVSIITGLDSSQIRRLLRSGMERGGRRLVEYLSRKEEDSRRGK